MPARTAFVPLTELPPETSNLVHHLPTYAQPERIGIDVAVVDKLASIGGFLPNVSIRGYSGELHQEQPAVMGYSNDGTAMAGAVRSAHISPAHPEYGASDNSAGGRVRKDLTLRLNVPELSDRVSRTKGDKPLRNPAIWSNHLNDALSSGLRDAAWQHLVRDKPPLGEVINVSSIAAVLTPGVILVDPYMSAELSPVDHPVAAALHIAGILSAVKYWNQRDVACHQGEPFYSPLPFWHPERAIAVSALSRMLPLVSPVE